MAERQGKIANYNSTNRQGEIKPLDGGPSALFYLPAVTNAEPLPKADDLVVFEAPDPRKNKKGKLVQGNASAVTITERSPERPPPPPPRPVSQRSGRDKRRGKPGERGRERRGSRREPRTVNRPGASPSPERRRVSPAVRRRSSRTSPPARPERRDRPERRKHSETASYAFPLPASVSRDVMKTAGFHPGLMLDRFFPWPLPRGGEWTSREKHKRFFFERFFEPAYRAYAARHLPWEALRTRHSALLALHVDDGYEVRTVRLRAESQLAVGLSAPSMLGMNGVLLSREWAAPFIPASSIRGVLRRYVREHPPGVEGTVSLFGSAEEAGRLIVFDGVPVGRMGRLEVGCLTCTFPDYLLGEGGPTDDQDPIVLSFLAVPAGAEFEFAFALRPAKEGGSDAQLADFIGSVLPSALSTFGLGGRRGVGYGRFLAIAEEERSTLPPATDLGAEGT